MNHKKSLSSLWKIKDKKIFLPFDQVFRFTLKTCSFISFIVLIILKSCLSQFRGIQAYVSFSHITGFKWAPFLKFDNFL